MIFERAARVTLAAVTAAIGGAAAAVALSTVAASSGIQDSADVAARVQLSADTSGCGTPGDGSSVWYVMVTECDGNYEGISATLTLPHPVPKIDGGGGGTHSNGQITLQQPLAAGSCGIAGVNAIEVSWVRYPTVTDRLYLQVGRIIGAQLDPNDIYPSKDWAPSPNQDNPQSPQPLSPDQVRKLLPASGNGWVDVINGFRQGASEALFPLSADITGNSPIDVKIQYSPELNGQWRVFVDGEQIGYYPDHIWPGGFHPTRAAWWGEVVSEKPTQGQPQSPPVSDKCGSSSGSESGLRSGNASCTAMGSGGLGGGAAGFSNMKTMGGGHQAARQIYVSDPSLYGSNKYVGTSRGVGGFDGDSFYYGGPGKCQPVATKQKTCEAGQQLDAAGKCQPDISPVTGFDKSSGPPGSTPTLSGSGFYPNKPVTVTESGPAGSRTVGTITTDSTGSFTMRFQVGDPTPEGTVTLTFRQAPDIKVTDSYYVTACRGCPVKPR